MLQFQLKVMIDFEETILAAKLKESISKKPNQLLDAFYSKR